MLETISNNLSEYWIVWLFAIVVLTLLANFIAKQVLRFLNKRVQKTKSLWDDALVGSIGVPLGWAIWLFGINFAAQFTAQVNDLPWDLSLTLFNKTATIILISWVILRFLARAEANLTTDRYLRQPMDLTTAKALRKLLHAAVIITTLLVVLQLYGVSVSGVLAFGGIGGIAVGFAARDLLANFFGAMMIYLDKPFSVGDWIRSPDREIEGTVEDIGWRQTVIRTFDKRPLYVPNSVFTSIAVENPSRMRNRRIYETLGVRYSDAAVLPDIVKDVKKMLQEHPEIDTKQTMIVNFNLFGPSSLDFFVYTFTKTTDWIKFHEIKQDVLLRIENIVNAQGAEFAFSTQTIHLDSEAPPVIPQTPADSTNL